MFNRIVSGAAFAAAIALTAPVAEAQKPVTIGVAGGLTQPIGDFSNSHQMGWNGTASLGFNFPASAVGVRFEGFYNALQSEAGLLAPGRGTVAGATANALYHLGGQSIRPYVIGGVGAYNHKNVVSTQSETDFGINAGAGLKFGLGALNTFVEARLHTISAKPEDIQYVPVVFGIEF